MKKEFFQQQARTSIHEQLQNGTTIREAKKFANDVLEISHEYPKHVPNHKIEELIKKYPELGSVFQKIFSQETKAQDAALQESLRKKIAG